MPYSTLVVSSSVADDCWPWKVSGEALAEWLGSKQEKQEGAKLAQSNHRFRISGNLALVTFEK